MLTVETTIGPSKLHGTGLFAAEFIEKGTLVWTLNKDFDRVYSEEELGKLPGIVQEYIRHYGHYTREEGGWVLCSDNARFFNHTEEANCASEIGSTYAKKDIQVGEEITDNYYEWDASAEAKLGKRA